MEGKILTPQDGARLADALTALANARPNEIRAKALEIIQGFEPSTRALEDGTRRKMALTAIASGLERMQEDNGPVTLLEAVSLSVRTMMAEQSPEFNRILEEAVAILKEESLFVVAFKPGNGWGFTNFETARLFSQMLAIQAASLWDEAPDEHKDRGTPEVEIVLDSFHSKTTPLPIPTARSVYRVEKGWQEEAPPLL